MMVRNLLADRRGTGALEYSLVAALVALLASNGISGIGQSIASKLQAAQTAMSPVKVEIRRERDGFLDRHKDQ